MGDSVLASLEKHIIETLGARIHTPLESGHAAIVLLCHGDWISISVDQAQSNTQPSSAAETKEAKPMIFEQESVLVIWLITEGRISQKYNQLVLRLKS